MGETMFYFNNADMKKLLLTGITAALFSVAAIAQEQDSLQNENNQFRENQEQTDPAEQAVDSVSTDFQEGVNEAEQEMDQAEDTLQQESNELRQDAERAGEKIEESAEEAGEDIKEAGEDIEEGAERTGEQMEENAEEAAEEVDQQTDKALNNMNDDSESTSGDSQSSATAPELEVVEGKEGPNNEVVYKYQDEYFYIDREKKEVVKAEESDLEDADHKVIVKESEKSGDESSSDAEQNDDASNSSDDNSSDNSNREAQTDKEQK
jgi:hypothetical protein